MIDDLLDGDMGAADTTPDSTNLENNIATHGNAFDPSFDITNACGSQHIQFGSAADIDMGSVLDSFNFHQNTIGTPGIDTSVWELQNTPFTCAVQAQRGIIEEFTGQPISEAQLVYEATTNGWLSDQGTSMHDVGKLLELHGVSCHTNTGASFEELFSELAQGHKVIVGVDSGELWNQDSPFEDFVQQSADHAIWVTGVNFDNPLHPQVIINDSGDPDGAGKSYDLDQFKDAWQDSGFNYVATDEAPPNRHVIAGVPPESESVFPEQTIKSFIDDLPNNPIASLNESATDILFRIL